MTSIWALADELAVDPFDVGVVLDSLGTPLSDDGLLTDGQAEDVRALLDPDQVRAAQ